MSTLFLPLSVAALFAFLLYRRSRNVVPLPPGPKPFPIISNMMDLPPEGAPEYKHWLKFKDLYGPISSVTVLGRTMVILHDRQATEDLMEKMSLKTSNRPEFVFGEMSGFGRYFSNRSYDATWRKHRKMVHQHMGTDKVSARFTGIQDVESRRLLLRALRDPKNLIQHFKTEAGAIVLKLTYGYAIEPHTSDPLVTAIEQMMRNLSSAMLPLSWTVDIIPSLRFIPGMPFHATAKNWYETNDVVTKVPYSFVKQQMANGTHRPSYVSSLIEENKGRLGEGRDVEDAIQGTAGIMYGAGADTTVSTLSAFVMAMIMFPAAQLKAQEEIEAVIGSDRLPELDDRDNLPYVSALVKETSRWFPIVPVNTTHATNQEILYRGYRIPKGSYLVVSNWYLLNNPDTYINPSSFEPRRFLEPRNEPDPALFMFGYGRRICPGRYIGERSLFLTISRILATFSIHKPVNGKGEEVGGRLNATPGLVSHPLEFPFEITPRSAAHAKLVEDSEMHTPWEKGDSGLLTL